MYSKKENQMLRQEFWIEFAEAYPHKWLLYNTKIKDFSLKFYADNKVAQVMIAIEMRDPLKRQAYFDKLIALRLLLAENFTDTLHFDANHFLDDGKAIGKVWVQLDGVSMSRRLDWPAIFQFFNDRMLAFEAFFLEYGDFIADANIN